MESHKSQSTKISASSKFFLFFYSKETQMNKHAHTHTDSQSEENMTKNQPQRFLNNELIINLYILVMQIYL